MQRVLLVEYTILPGTGNIMPTLCLAITEEGNCLDGNIVHSLLTYVGTAQFYSSHWNPGTSTLTIDVPHGPDFGGLTLSQAASAFEQMLDPGSTVVMTDSTDQDFIEAARHRRRKRIHL